MMHGPLKTKRRPLKRVRFKPEIAKTFQKGRFNSGDTIERQGKDDPEGPQRARQRADYAVGFRKPPKSTQFKKGRSGNPKGRPKGINNLKTDVLATLQTATAVAINGRKKNISTQAALLLKLRSEALSGNHRAIDRLCDLALRMNNEEATPQSDAISGDDLESLKLYCAIRGFDLVTTNERSTLHGDDEPIAATLADKVPKASP